MLSKFFVFKLIVLAVKLNLVFGLDKKAHCTCKANVQPNIVGGKTIKFNELPWMASVTDSGFHKFNQPTNQPNDDYKIKDHKCTAFVLNELWVITTKTCTLKEDLVYSVGFGYDKVEMFDKKIKVNHVHRHEDPNVDISLLELTEPINFDENLRPACIDTKQYDQIKSQNPELMAAGFGKNVSYFQYLGTEEKLFYDKNQQKSLIEELATNIDSKYLKEVDMIDVSDQECLDNPAILCANNKFSDFTVCYGDEGGPLHYTHNGKKFVVGLLKKRFAKMKGKRSKLINYCEGVHLVYYDRIAPLVDWIKGHLGENNYCDDNVENEAEPSSQKSIRLFGKDYPIKQKREDRDDDDDPEAKRQKVSKQ